MASESNWNEPMPVQVTVLHKLSTLLSDAVSLNEDQCGLGPKVDSFTLWLQAICAKSFLGSKVTTWVSGIKTAH